MSILDHENMVLLIYSFALEYLLSRTVKPFANLEIEFAMLRWLLRLLSPKKPFVPPTQKQLEYAKLCGVCVRPDMDRDSVSKEIDAAFEADPKLKFKIGARRKREKTQAADQMTKLPAKLKREFEKWENSAGDRDHFLVVYSSGKGSVVDILECDDARLDPTAGEIVIEFLSPRIEEVVAGYDGSQEIREKELCWDQRLTLSLSKIVESRKIEIFGDEIDKYMSSIKRKIEQLNR